MLRIAREEFFLDVERVSWFGSCFYLVVNEGGVREFLESPELDDTALSA